MVSIKKQSGFTLVEIAIVLVIIGLLLGGILKGQELITSARVRNLADQNSGIQAAYYGFIDRYRSLPGDMTPGPAQNAIGDATLAGVGGNANGQLDDGSQSEAANVWAHLRASGFITGGYPGGTGITSSVLYAGTNVNGQDIAPRNAFLGSVILTNLDEYQVLAPAVAAVRLAYVFGAQVPVNVMRELDVKIDDSVPTTGVMRASALAAVGLTSIGGVELEPANPLPCTAAAVAPVVGTIWNILGNAQNCNATYIY